MQGMKRGRMSGWDQRSIGLVGTGLIVFLFLMMPFVSPAIPVAFASPPSQSPEEGASLFQEKCTACHTVGGGDLVGPDLAGVTNRRGEDWLRRWIAEPDQMLAEGDPIATDLLAQYSNVPMPNLGLSDGEVASLIVYLESTSPAQASPAEAGAAAGSGQASAAQGAGAAPGELPEGDPVIGKNLFTGTVRSQNRGPACRSCHSVGGIGALGGGALGPDLTQAIDKYGGAKGLAAFLSGVPTATMNAVWSDKPLTAQERADLSAFLQKAAVGPRPTEKVGVLAGLAVAGAALVALVAQITWRRRLRSVRRPMLGARTR